MKEAVKLPMVCISSNNDIHPVPKTFTPLHYKVWARYGKFLSASLM